MPTISSSRGPALGDAFDGVVDQRAGKPVHRGLRIVLADGEQRAILLLDLDPQREVVYPALPLGPWTSDGVAFDLDRYSLGDGDRLFSNS